MNKQVIYDNHANDIEYFKPKVQVKKKSEKFDITVVSDNELLQKIAESQIKREELSIMHNLTKDESTFTQISKLTSFISVMRGEARKRKLETYDNLTKQISELESQLIDLTKGSVSADDKTITHLNLVNENLKKEVYSLREKNIEQKKKIQELQTNISKNKELEKTKRHEINVNQEKYKFVYLKEYVKNLVDENEYNKIIEDLQELDENTPQ